MLNLSGSICTHFSYRSSAQLLIDGVVRKNHNKVMAISHGVGYIDFCHEVHMYLPLM